MGSNAAKLLFVRGRKFFQYALASCGERETNLATVGNRVFSDDKISRNKSIHKAHSAVMANLEAFSQSPDCDELVLRKTFYSEQCLVLLRRKPGLMRCLFAEVQELTE